MNRIHSSAQVSAALDIRWQSQGVSHHEHFFIGKLNTWRDLDPSSILFPVTRAARGETISVQGLPGEIAGPHDPQKVIKLRNNRLGLDRQALVAGRFYPQGIISGISGVFKGNITPFRLVDIDNAWAVVDLNHPLAGQAVDLDIKVVDIHRRKQERGGSCMDWMQAVLDGPGMQQRIKKDTPTPFMTGRMLGREDERSDHLFYQIDRFVPHIDNTASGQLSGLYGSIIAPEARVLDLMAGWISHLPGTFSAGRVYGLGMNPNELAANPLLSDTIVQDLNQTRVLPFDDHFFDAVICSLSVEYLTRPVQVFEQVGRVLKPGGVFAVCFSNRWFPEKAIRIWEDLHEFERQGMVLEYFHGAGCFNRLETFSVRGYPRPRDDTYADRLLLSDPVFMVTGKKK